ncbi:MAG TPA: glycosyltransferase family 9 protein [Bryobacteraceae bacterium]|nr:glycosyltransferase family 9 protein [Bryobacteraceae bacterium]
MESIYSQQLLEHCLRNEPWTSELLDRAIGEDEGRALLSIVVERLGDLFEPPLCRTYEQLFTQVIERVCPDLIPRLRTNASQQAPPATADRVYVLSRITLGADVAVTSVLLDAAKQRYPAAEIIFVGPRKSFEMFEADPRIRHLPAPYARSGALIDRLRASASLHFEDGIVIDPDSRLTQLGLISICDEKNYFFFESRSYGGPETESLPSLASRWARERFGVHDAHPYIAPLPSTDPPADITVSLGVGENPAKRIDGAFERDLLSALAATGSSILIDKGASAEERDRVERAVLPGMRTHDGAFAPFAAQIARSKLYVGYDSAGQHVASAAGVPLIAIFKGFVNERFFSRWRPQGTVIRGDSPNVIAQVRSAITRKK